MGCFQANSDRIPTMYFLITHIRKHSLKLVCISVSNLLHIVIIFTCKSLSWTHFFNLFSLSLPLFLCSLCFWTIFFSISSLCLQEDMKFIKVVTFNQWCYLLLFNVYILSVFEEQLKKTVSVHMSLIFPSTFLKADQPHGLVVRALDY